MSLPANAAFATHGPRALYNRVAERMTAWIGHDVIALVARFGIAGMDERVARFAERVRASRPAHGVSRIYAPGDRARARRAERGDECLLAPELLAQLKECGAKVGVQGEP